MIYLGPYLGSIVANDRQGVNWLDHAFFTTLKTINNIWKLYQNKLTTL